MKEERGVCLAEVDQNLWVREFRLHSLCSFSQLTHHTHTTPRQCHRAVLVPCQGRSTRGPSRELFVSFGRCKLCVH